LQIIYRIEYWPLIAEGLLIAVLVVSFFVFGLNKAYSPRLIKKIGKRGDSYTAVLEIKNANKRLNNVVIRDYVSPLFQVKDTFETLKPAIRQTHEGTELIWTFGAIEPRDHRIIHYLLKPVISGRLMIPKASMKYDAGRRRSKKIYSDGFSIAS
jgi:hypothetical protein